MRLDGFVIRNARKMKPNVTNKINALVFIISQLRKKVQRKPYIEPVLIRTGSFLCSQKSSMIKEWLVYSLGKEHSETLYRSTAFRIR